MWSANVDSPAPLLFCLTRVWKPKTKPISKFGLFPMGLLRIPMPCLVARLHFVLVVSHAPHPMLFWVRWTHQREAFQDLVEHTRALQSMGKAKRWDLSPGFTATPPGRLGAGGKTHGNSMRTGEFKGTGLSFWEVEATVSHLKYSKVTCLKMIFLPCLCTSRFVSTYCGIAFHPIVRCQFFQSVVEITWEPVLRRTQTIAFRFPPKLPTQFILIISQIIQWPIGINWGTWTPHISLEVIPQEPPICRLNPYDFMAPALWGTKKKPYLSIKIHNLSIFYKDL